MKVDILGVKIDDLTMTEALLVVEKWIWNPGPDSDFVVNRGSRANGIRREKHCIVTPNPEMIVAAQTDSDFRQALNDADLSIPDGAGLKLSGKVKNTFAGTDFMEKLVKLSAEKGFVTGFLGGRDGVAKKAAECLKKKYPSLKVAFAEGGGDVDSQGNILRAKREVSLRPIIVSKVSSRSALQNSNNIPTVDILFVAFGHQKQEKWIAANLKDIPVKVAMGVGGSFDYLSGSVPRAPKFLRNLGLEWLFRLIIQPWRIKRQLALIKYLWLLFLSSWT
ncbi:MAG: WecB/TagA/CpsF family glycosyltransferase [Candidatus Daviesbacteria bacterium]|nr:WecB/TagA/CpsF family glycosyltransferase [Candidatus Daviesbacteria bacterium]